MKKMTLEQMAIYNGDCTYQGARYILLQGAHIDGPEDGPAEYEAMAIREGDIPDADGWQPAYLVEWELLDDYDPECGDESLACDWDHPTNVWENGKYNLSQQRYD